MKRALALTAAFLAVHPAQFLLHVGRGTGDAIALAEPFQKVAVLASAAAERRMLGVLRLAA